MFSFEAVWIIPMTLVLVCLGILLIGYGVILDDFLLSGERSFILNAQKTGSLNEREYEAVKLKEKNLFVFTQLEMAVDKIGSQVFLNGEKAHLEMTFKGIDIQRIRMGLVAKYGKEIFEKER